MRFIDGFGMSRVFCRTCQHSVPIEDAIVNQDRIPVFQEFKKPVTVRRWSNERIRTIGSFIDGR